MKHALGLASALTALIFFGACRSGPPAVSNTQSAGGGPDVFFATSPGGPSGDQSLFRGPLVVQDGCVFVGAAGNLSLPVWPKGFMTGSDSSDRLIVKDTDGARVATEGEMFEMGGGYTVEFLPRDKVEPRQKQLDRLSSWLGYSIPGSCLGNGVYGVWVVGETQPLAS